MPKFARQARLSKEHEALALDMLLDGMPLPPEAPPEMSALPPMLADLSGPAGPSELAGEGAALSRFRRHLSPAGVSSRRNPERRMPSWQSPGRRAQLAAALAVAAIGLGSTAAAYAGVLPSPVQAIAHHYFGAPPASPAPHHPGTSAGRARHRHPAPAARPGAALPDVPPGHPNHAGGYGHAAKPRRWLLNPHHRGHAIPPGQRDKLSPPVQQKEPAQPTHPAHPSHPAPPAPAAQGRVPQSPGRGPHSDVPPPGHFARHHHRSPGPPFQARSRAR